MLSVMTCSNYSLPPDVDPNYYDPTSDQAQPWSRLPKIMQAQPEGGYIDLNEPQVMYPNRLSTITEHTEKTEVASMFTRAESTIDQPMGTPCNISAV